MSKTYTFSAVRDCGAMTKQTTASHAIHAGPSPLFCDFATEHYLPYARGHKKSWKTDERYLRLHVLPHLGALPLSHISADVLDEWRAQLEISGLSPSSCYRLFWLVKYMLNCAVRWRLLESDAAFKSAACPRTPRRRPELLSSEEALQLVRLLKSSPENSGMQAIHLLLLTGAGKSEILNARWEDVDLAHGILITRTSFTGRIRHIPLNSEAMTLIRKLPRRPDVPWLFASSRGTPLTSLHYAWDRLRTRLGRPDLRLADLRHCFAHFLMNMGMQRSELLSVMGHYRPETLCLLAPSRSDTRGTP